MEPVQQKKAQSGRDNMEADTRGLAAQHPLPDRAVLRAALTGKTGLPGASSKAERAWPAQGSSWQWGDQNHWGWAAQPWSSSGPSSLKENNQRRKFSPPQYIPPAAHNIYMLHSFLCQQWDVFGNPGQQSQQPVTHHICWQQDNLGDLPADNTSSTQTLTSHIHAPAATPEFESLQPGSLQPAIPK